MLTISQLATYAGVTVRAVRHYHAKGLLPEPERDHSGYRRYDASAVVELVRIRTLAEAGVPLSKVRCSLALPCTLGVTGWPPAPDADAGGGISPRASRSTGAGARPGQSVVSAARGTGSATRTRCLFPGSAPGPPSRSRVASGEQAARRASSKPLRAPRSTLALRAT